MDLDPVVKQLVAAVRNLEVSINSVSYCYTRNPGNFPTAMQAAKDDAEDARTLLGELRKMGYPS